MQSTKAIILPRGNQLQAISYLADHLEKEQRISVVRCHLGNPMGPRYKPADEWLARYSEICGDIPTSYGYENVNGPQQARAIIAEAMNKIDKLGKNALKAENIIGVVGGTGGLNAAVGSFKDATILVSDPYYPPWQNISELSHNRFDRFTLQPRWQKPENAALLDEQALTDKIVSINMRDKNKDVVLIYHYPHNPTGKTLTPEDAKKVAHTLNNLCEKFPNLHLVQEDLYLATTAPDMGLHTPLEHLNENTRKRTMLILSPSKMGGQQSRGAFVAAFNPELVSRLSEQVSFRNLGGNMPALYHTAIILQHISQGGIDAENAPGSDPNNHRFVTARFYQDRLKVAYEALHEIEKKTGANIINGGMPKGAYYLDADFACLKGKKIPELLLKSGAFGEKDHFENAKDVANALAHAYLLGLRPVTVTSGTLFRQNPGTMYVRIATVEPDIEKMKDAGNTFKGLVQQTLGVDLGAQTMSIPDMQEKWKPADKTKFTGFITRSTKPVGPDGEYTGNNRIKVLTSMYRLPDGSVIGRDR